VGVTGISPCDLSRRSYAVGITKTEAIPVYIKAVKALTQGFAGRPIMATPQGFAEEDLNQG